MTSFDETLNDREFLDAVMEHVEERGWDREPVFTEEMLRDATEFGRRWAAEHTQGADNPIYPQERK